MYEPVFNSILVQIDDKDAQWGSGNDESMLGKSYSKGTVIRYGQPHITKDYSSQELIDGYVITKLDVLLGKQIIWNEGVEAGTTFEFDGKLFGMIYWWDVRGVLTGLTESELNKQFAKAKVAADSTK